MPLYSPGPVPLEPTSLQLYLQTELQRIADILSGSVERAYGGLNQSPGDVVVPLSPVPVQFDVWDLVTPILTLPEGVEADAGAGSLTILSPGVFIGFFFTTSNALPVNAEYEFRFLRNGIPQDANTQIDPSNQTDRITAEMYGIVTFAKGDVVTVQASSATSDDWTSSESQVFAFRVSERFS